MYHTDHALRFTGPNSRPAYAMPATHFAPAGYTGRDAPYMGMRVRLAASYDCSVLPRAARIVCTALKKYGAFFADNGLPWDFAGEAVDWGLACGGARWRREGWEKADALLIQTANYVRKSQPEPTRPLHPLLCEPPTTQTPHPAGEATEKWYPLFAELNNVSLIPSSAMEVRA